MTLLFWVSYLGLWVLVFALSLAVFVLYRVNGQMLLSVRVPTEALIDSTLSPLSVTSETDGSVRLGRPNRRPEVVQFLTNVCSVCEGTVEELAQWIEQTSPDADVVVVVAGKGDALLQSGAMGRIRAHGVQVIQDVEWTSSLEWGVRRVPWTMVVSQGGVLSASGGPQTQDGFQELLRSSQSRRGPG